MSPTSPALSDPHLARLLTQAESVAPTVAALCDGLSREQLLWRPAPHSWGIAHCLDHLRVSGESYFPRLRAAIERARTEGWKRRREYRSSFLAGFLIRAIDPASKRRLPAPKKVVPAPEPPPMVREGFLASHEVLVDLLRAADGFDLARPRFASPLFPLLRMGSGDALTLLVLHEQRHLQQARRVREAPGFPT